MMRKRRSHTPFAGRSRELGALRSALDGTEATLLRVAGLRGVGKSALVTRALESFEHEVVRVPALPEPLQRTALHRSLVEGPDAPESPATEGQDPSRSWEALFAWTTRRARPGRSPWVLVLDDAHRLEESRARYLPPLLAALRDARAHHRPFHVVLVSPLLPQIPAGYEELLAEPMQVDPLPLRAALELLPGSSPEEVLRAYGVFGGIPRVLGALDPSLTLETNVRRVLLDPESPVADVPGSWLERDLQTPSRYNAVLATLALGECDWARLHEGVPDLTSSGQLAPYVRRLEELGLVRVRRSLDAAPTGRSRRYALTDPFFAFWYRFLLRDAGAPSTRAQADARLRSIRSAFESHLGTMFPTICRQHMRYDAIETLGSNARELGSLWGAGYDIPVAGILTSGAAFFGACHWRPPVRGDDPLGALESEARETRYAFGRERRFRLLFTRAEPPRWLERDALRRDQTILLGPGELVGDRRAGA